MKIILKHTCLGNFLVEAEDMLGILIQTDWEYPGVARIFGWDGLRYRHKHMSMKPKCPACKDLVSFEINQARRWLDNHTGLEVEDPGYFKERILTWKRFEI